MRKMSPRRKIRHFEVVATVLTLLVLFPLSSSMGEEVGKSSDRQTAERIEPTDLLVKLGISRKSIPSQKGVQTLLDMGVAQKMKERGAPEQILKPFLSKTQIIVPVVQTISFNNPKLEQMFHGVIMMSVQASEERHRSIQEAQESYVTPMSLMMLAVILDDPQNAGLSPAELKVVEDTYGIKDIPRLRQRLNYTAALELVEQYHREGKGFRALTDAQKNKLLNLLDNGGKAGEELSRMLQGVVKQTDNLRDNAMLKQTQQKKSQLEKEIQNFQNFLGRPRNMHMATDAEHAATVAQASGEIRRIKVEIAYLDGQRDLYWPFRLKQKDLEERLAGDPDNRVLQAEKKYLEAAYADDKNELEMEFIAKEGPYKGPYRFHPLLPSSQSARHNKVLSSMHKKSARRLYELEVRYQGKFMPSDVEGAIEQHERDLIHAESALEETNAELERVQGQILLGENAKAGTAGQAQQRTQLQRELNELIKRKERIAFRVVDATRRVEADLVVARIRSEYAGEITRKNKQVEELRSVQGQAAAPGDARHALLRKKFDKAQMEVSKIYYERDVKIGEEQLRILSGTANFSVPTTQSTLKQTRDFLAQTTARIAELEDEIRRLSVPVAMPPAPAAHVKDDSAKAKPVSLERSEAIDKPIPAPRIVKPPKTPGPAAGDTAPPLAAPAARRELLSPAEVKAPASNPAPLKEMQMKALVFNAGKIHTEYYRQGEFIRKPRSYTYGKMDEDGKVVEITRSEIEYGKDSRGKITDRMTAYREVMKDMGGNEFATLDRMHIRYGAEGRENGYQEVLTVQEKIPPGDITRSLRVMEDGRQTRVTTRLDASGNEKKMVDTERQNSLVAATLRNINDVSRRESSLQPASPRKMQKIAFQHFKESMQRLNDSMEKIRKSAEDSARQMERLDRLISQSKFVAAQDNRQGSAGGPKLPQPPEVDHLEDQR